MKGGSWKTEKGKDGEEEKENHGSSEDETDDGNSSNTDCDQDSDISFKNDTDEEFDTAEIKEEDWIEYMKRRTEEAMELMIAAKIHCWIKTHRRMKWRLALRIASPADERWVVKATERNHEVQNLQSCGKTKEKMGRRSQ